MSCLAVADSEGRNGVWLAQQRGVDMKFGQADLTQWEWGTGRFDLVVAVFIQFAPPGMRERMFDGIKRCLKPGGLLLLQGYTPRQLEYKTGGPSQAENLYTEAMLRAAFADMEILQLREHDDFIGEGTDHRGMSALIDLAARKPA